MAYYANDAARAERKARAEEKLNKRVTEIDALRGVAVILMVFDHFMYDIIGLMPGIFGEYEPGSFFYQFAKIARSYWHWDVRIYVRLFVMFIFLSLTGISCSFSRSNIKRGLKLGAVALGLTAITVAVDLIGGMGGRAVIVFGILHLIAFSLILVALVEKLTKNKWVYLAIGVTLVAAGLMIASPVGLREYYVDPERFFSQFFDMFIGKILLGPDSYSFPFYGGQVFIGVFLGKLLYPERKSLIFKKGYSNDPLTFLGRHTLIVYAAHQVVIPLILGVILLLCGYSLQL